MAGSLIIESFSAHKKRSAAIAAGDKFYFTGVPCIRGHVVNRYAPNGTCTVCLEQMLKIARPKYARENKEKCREAKRQYASKNKAKIAARTRARQAGLSRATPSWVDRSQLEKFYVKARELTQETGIKHSVDHIYPLKGRNFCGLHVPWNLQVVPHLVNLSKGSKNPTESDISKHAIAVTFTYGWHRGGLCKRGHGVTEENVRITKKGTSICKACHRMHSKHFAAKTNYAAQKKHKAKLRANREWASATT